MKFTGTCHKCQNKTIVRAPGGTAGNHYLPHISTGVLAWSTVPITTYVCTNCGFCEQWIDEPEDIRKVAEKFGTPG